MKYIYTLIIGGCLMIILSVSAHSQTMRLFCKINGEEKECTQVKSYIIYEDLHIMGFVGDNATIDLCIEKEVLPGPFPKRFDNTGNSIVDWISLDWFSQKGSKTFWKARSGYVDVENHDPEKLQISGTFEFEVEKIIDSRATGTLSKISEGRFEVTYKKTKN